MMNRYGMRVSPCMVPRLVVIGGVVPKWFPVKVVMKFLYLFPTISIASRGNPKSSIMASSRAWSMKSEGIFLSLCMLGICLCG